MNDEEKVVQMRKHDIQSDNTNNHVIHDPVYEDRPVADGGTVLGWGDDYWDAVPRKKRSVWARLRQALPF